MLPTSIKPLDLPASGRVIVVSDIHGNRDLFLKLLSKCEYRKGVDRLILLGDYFEKGKQILETIETLVDISQMDYTYMIRGNCERFERLLLYRYNEDEVLSYCKKRPWNILTATAAKIGINEVKKENLAKVRQQCNDYLRPVMEGLETLPLALESEAYIFCHAGLANRRDWKQSADHEVTWQENFWQTGHQAEKTVVAGHLPTRNQKESGLTDLPLISQEKKIIMVDGGCNVSMGGQLNAFIMEFSNGKVEYSTVWEDEFPKICASASAEGDLSGFVHTGYFNNTIEILETGEHFSQCRLTKSGETGLVKNEYIDYSFSDKPVTWLSMSSFVPVKKGELLSVIDNSRTGYALVRNSADQLGWVEKQLLARGV